MGEDWGGVLADGGADTHEEAVLELACGLHSKIIEHSRGKTCPKVAPDPSMYCPRERITPFGPAPYLMMLTDPKMKPMMAPTAALYISISSVDLIVRLLNKGKGVHTATHHSTHLHYNSVSLRPFGTLGAGNSRLSKVDGPPMFAPTGTGIFAVY